MLTLPKVTRLLFLCNILKEKVSDEIDFSHEDKHESSLQIDTIIFDGDGLTFPKIPQNQVSNVFIISPKAS